jgi:Holliday junction DNA helicase RuvA
MIAHLRGRILRKGPQDVVLDVQGVGYLAAIPVSTFCRLGNPGDDAALLVHTHVREDALQLYAFVTEAELAIFERLIAVSGIGPRVALSILSGIEPPNLVAALRDSDVARLTRVPGVGRKTAERLILELRDKVKDLASLAQPASQENQSSSRSDIVSALVHLGYSQPEADRAAERVLADHHGVRFEDLLRLALQEASKR